MIPYLYNIPDALADIRIYYIIKSHLIFLLLMPNGTGFYHYRRVSVINSSRIKCFIDYLLRDIYIKIYIYFARLAIMSSVFFLD